MTEHHFWLLMEILPNDKRILRCIYNPEEIDFSKRELCNTTIFGEIQLFKVYFLI